MFFGGIPFPFGGGFPTGPGFSGAEANEKIDNEKFYNTLQVPKDADLQTIKKSYRKLALACHPDRGGDAEQFKELSVAYETLSDPEKRSLYDRYGEAGLEKGAGGGADFDLSSLFGGGGPRGPPKKKKGADIVHNINVKLEQLYTGLTKNLQLNKKYLCRNCKGHGAPQSAFKECGRCRGKGKVTVVQRMGNMVSQSVNSCTDCHGQGRTVSGPKCSDCNGSGKYTEKKILEVYIPANSPDKYKVVFRGDGDENLNEIPGDVIVIINEEKHDTFTRNDDNLLMVMKISLVEALTGVKRVVNHVAKRKLLILSKPGEVIAPGSCKMIPDEGMPKKSNPALRGQLVVKFEVEFPETVTEDVSKALKTLLATKGKGVSKREEEEGEVVFLEEAPAGAFDVEDRKGKGGNGGARGHQQNAYDEDDYEDEDEGHHGGGGVQCQQA